MGMLKEGVRLDRVRGGRQKYRRNPNMQPYQLQIPHSSSQPPQTLEDIKMLDVLASFEPEKLCVGHCSIDLMSKNDDVDVKSESVAPDAQELINVLSDLYDKELVGVIGWAKQIPGASALTFKLEPSRIILLLSLVGFTDLPLNDQMRLLQVSWAEILTLMLAFRSIPFTGRLYFATDFWLDERSAKECGATELYNHVSLALHRHFVSRAVVF
jgi:estrogen-related receptor ERR